MGRPSSPIELKPIAVQIRVTPIVYDAIYRLASNRHQSMYTFLGALVDRVFQQHVKNHATKPCYRDPQASSTLLGIIQDEEDQSLGRR